MVEFMKRGILGMAVLVFVLTPMVAFAASGADTWQGSSGSSDFNVTNNWASGSTNNPPASGDSWAFGTTSHSTTLQNNLNEGLSVTGITFNSGASAYTINGDSIILSNGAALANNSTSNQILNLPTTLGTSVTNSGSGSGAVALSGAVTVNSSGSTLINTSTSSQLQITNGITGSGNLTLQNNTSLANGIAISGGSINNAGTITNSGSGSGAETISAPIGSNVTGIKESAASSNLNVTGQLTVAGGGTTITNSSSGTGVVNLSGGVTGTGDLILQNNSATLNGVTLSGASINNHGTIIDSGTGSGKTLISAAIGSNVTGITHSAAAESLSVTGQLTVNSSGTTVTNSSSNSTVALLGGVTGTGNLILDNDNNGGSLQVQIGDIANSGIIINSGTGNGTTSINSNIDSSVTGITESSLNSVLYLGCQLTVNQNGTTIINSSGTGGTGVVILTGGVTGTGDLILQNDTAVSNGILIETTDVANTGAIINSGTGTSSTSISANIESSVTGIEEDAASSALNISGNLAVNSSGTTLTDTTGALTLSGNVSGTGNLILQNNGTVANGLTLSGAVDNTGSITNSGSYSVKISGNIGSAVTSIVQNSGSLALTGDNSSFTGNTYINGGGLLAKNSTALGTGGTVYLGSSSGSDAADLALGDAGTYANAIVLGETSGTLMLENVSGNALILSGGVTGSNSFIIDENAGSSGITFSGLVNNAGTVTNTGVGTGTTVLSGGVGTNMTGLTEDSSTSALSVTGGLVVNASGTTLTDTTGSLTVSGGVTGTGDLILDNNSATDGGITISGTSVDNVGTITNSGSGNGSSLISAGIGSNVTGVTENSSTSALSIGNVALNTSGTTLTDSLGTLTVTGNVTGSGNLTLNNDSATDGGITLANVSLSTGEQTLTNSGTGTGSTNITALSGLESYVVENSITSALNVTGSLTVDSPGVELINESGISLLTVSGAVTGSGSLLLANNSATNNGVVLSGSGISGTDVNDQLSIVNLGGGTGTVLISAPIGAYVEKIEQDSAYSSLILSGNNSFFTGEIDVEAGTLQGGDADVFGGASSTSAVVMDGGTLDMGGFDQALGSLTGTGLITTSAAGAGDATLNLSVGNNDSSPAAYSGVIEDGSGTVDLTKVGTGTLILSGTNTYSGGTTISAGTLQVESARALGTGAVTNDATLNLGTTGLVLDSTYTQASGSVLDLTANSSSSYGNITATGLSISPSSTINVTVGGYIPNGAVLTIAAPTIVPKYPTLGEGGLPTVNTLASSRVSFTDSASGRNLILTADHTTNGFASLADNANAHTVGAVLDDVTNPTGDMTNVLNALEFMSNAKVTAALNTLTPIVDAGVQQTSYASLSNFVATTVQRAQNVLNLVSNGNANNTGLSAGDKADLNGLWAKEYGGYLDQSSNQGIAGYTAWNTGTAVGVDHLFNDSLTVGLSGGYSYGSVSSSINSGNTDINSALATLYAGYQDASQPYFIDAAASNAWNWYDGRRDITVDTLDSQASSSYRGEQYGTYLDGGYKIKVTNNLDVAPIASLQWDHLNLGSYTERNAGSLDLHVDRQSYDLLESGLGVSLTMPQTKLFGTMSPEVHAKWLHDFINDHMTTTSSFTGGGASFVTSGAKLAKDGADVGGKLSFDLKKDLSVVAELDAQMRDNFYSIYGSAEVRYQF